MSNAARACSSTAAREKNLPLRDAREDQEHRRDSRVADALQQHEERRELELFALAVVIRAELGAGQPLLRDPEDHKGRPHAHDQERELEVDRGHRRRRREQEQQLRSGGAHKRAT